MVLKAILLDLSGIIINDKLINQELIDELLLAENLQPQGKQINRGSVERDRRSILQKLWQAQGRFLSDENLDKLVIKKAKSYAEKLEQIITLPIYPEVIQFIDRLRNDGYKLALVTDSIQSEVALVLKQCELDRYFDAIVSGEEITQNKPDPAGYLMAIDRLNQLHPDLNLLPSECLSIEHTFAGLKAVKSLGIQAVAIAHSYPFHMLQRRANWTIDCFADLELDRITKFFDPLTPIS